MKKPIIYLIILLFFVTSVVSLIAGCTNKQQPAIAEITEFQFKDKLSEYGFFIGELNKLQPNKSVFHYQLATSLFSDYTVKDRYISLPNGKALQYTSTGVLNFPDSSIIIKNFAYNNEDHEKIMIETRLLVKDPFDQKWKVMDYLWNKDQTDATKHITGAKIPITLLNEEGVVIHTVYHVPNTNDCKRCHINNADLTPIGPKARNLNIVADGQNENQLTQWAHNGLLQGLPNSPLEQLPNWKDIKHFTLQQRARAYLDMNCAHCHTKGGDAFNTGLFLEYQQTDPAHLGIFKTPVSAGGGAGGLDYDIVPGDATHSVLAYRMNSTEAGTAMPELGRTLIHKEGVKLIVDWINSLPKQKK